MLLKDHTRSCFFVQLLASEVTVFNKRLILRDFMNDSTDKTNTI